ncbi:TPA: hypothetical protein QCR51_004896 [Bacillus cereus]|nr:hypothetical protein [Bacillus cereus]
MKKLFPLFMAIFLLFVVTVPEIAFAEDEPKATEANTISGNLFDKTKQEDFENKNYEIDTAPHKDDEKGAFSKAWGYMFGDDSMGKDIQRKINGVGQWIVSLMFQFGVWLTKILLFVVEQSFDLDIIESIADKLGEAMQNIAGIGSKPEFESQGLFPAIIKMTCIFSVLYFLYLFFVKRQMTKGVSELFKVVLVIAGILVYIANAPAILKGMNTISSEISLQVLSKTTGTLEGNPGQSKEAAISNVKKQMWDLMVDRPYLYLQYGQDSKDKIGEERIKKLLDTPPGEDRTKIVSEDVEKHKNFMMTNDSVGERLIFTFMYYTVNTFAGAPTAVICLLIIACQLLFMIMSIIGPIAMAFALLPKNRRVLISWAEQWLKPLAAKIFLSLIVIILFSIAGMLYKLPEAGTSGYIMTMILQILVFVLCYLFRDNIKAAFRRSKLAYNTFTDLEQMAGKTKNGFNRTVDGINSGLDKAKDMFWDSTPIDMGDDSAEHTADDTKTKQATLDEEKATTGSEEEEEKQQYASVGEDADEDEDKRVNLEKESNEEGQQHDEVDQAEGEQDKAAMDDDEMVVATEQEETEEYREDQEEVDPENLASLEGIDEEEEQNPELSDVENPEQVEQDDPSEYETEYEEGNNEELVTTEGVETDVSQENPEIPEVEAPNHVEQDDSAEYESEHEARDEGKQATTGGIENASQAEHSEASEIETPRQPEQDNVSQYENENTEGSSNDLANVNDLTATEGTSNVIKTSDIEGNSIGNNSTKESSSNPFDMASPNGNGTNTGSMDVNAIPDTPIDSSGDLATTSSDPLTSAGTISGQSMDGDSLGDPKITSQSIEGGREIKGKDLVAETEAKSQVHTESSQVDKTNNTSRAAHIEAAQEVAASEDMLDATQEKTELETIVEESEPNEQDELEVK